MQSIPNMTISNDLQKHRTLEICLRIWLADKYNLSKMSAGKMAAGIFPLGSKNFPFLLVLVLVFFRQFSEQKSKRIELKLTSSYRELYTSPFPHSQR